MIGRALSHYRIVSRLGAGGMGEVYLAEDTKLGRKVALKVLPAELAGDPERLARLEREARALAALDHPNIVTVHSVEEADGVRFLTMAHVDGETLDHEIPAGGMTAARLVERALPLADALRAAHEKGIVHRDLKPGNVLVDREGRLRVLDFGLAKSTAGGAGRAPAAPLETLSETGVVVGTVPYMSPEQLEGRTVDPRSDLFSLGTMLWEMATGERPFRGESAVSVAASVLKEQPAPLATVRTDLPARMTALVDRCLEKDPAQRPQFAREVVDELREVERQIDSLAMAATTVAPAPPPPPRRWPRWAAAAAVVGALAALAVVVTDAGGWRTRIATRADARDRGEIRALAVLPLDNLSGDPDQEYLAAGLTDALITNLSKIGALRVISRTSAMRYRESDKSLPQIARELGVDAVVEGAVAREGGRVRVTAQLVDGATDRHLWAESYERELESVLALQGEVARAIAGAVEVQLSGEEDRALAAAPPVDPQAHEAYLRGLHHLNRGTAEGNERGLEHLRRAIELDPESARAWSGLALGYVIAAHGPAPPVDAFPRAVAAAGRALELDEASAGAHAALAMVLEYQEWEWDAALRAFERALELDPSLAETRAHYSWNLQLRGRFEEALAEMVRAEESDPLTPMWPAWRGWQLHELGRHAEAVEAARAALELEPEHPVALFVLGNALGGLGRWNEALAAHRRAAADPLWRWAPGLSLAGMGRAEEARAFAAEVAANAGLWDTLFLAEIHALLGDRDTALDWLERAFGEPHHPYAPWIERVPAFESLRLEPRYRALLDRLGLPEEALARSG